MAERLGEFVYFLRDVIHDFRNESDARFRLFNVFPPGEFESAMPHIVTLFAGNSTRTI